MTRKKGFLKLWPVSSDLTTAATCTLMKLQVLLHHLLLTSVRLLLKETVYVIVRELNLYLLNQVRIKSYVSDHVSVHVKYITYIICKIIYTLYSIYLGMK